jgi:hypothetical protein
VNLTLFEEPGMGAGTVLEQLAAAGVTLGLDDVRGWTKYELMLAYDWARRSAILREDPAAEVTGRPKPSFVTAAERAREEDAPANGMARRVEHALEVIAACDEADGAHHLQWALDQAARHLTGCVYEPATGTTGEPLGHDRLGTSGAYLAWRPEGWDRGIAP